MSICVKCQGRKMLCGLPRCPVLDRMTALKASYMKIKDNVVFGATPPSAVVGEAGWPDVRVYVGEPPEVFGEEARRFDDAGLLWGLPLEEIIRRRSYMAFGYKRAKRPWDVGELALAALSARPVDVEMKLAKRPDPRIELDLREKPMGPKAPLDAYKLAGNPSIPRPLDSMITDDVQAGEAAVELYAKGIDIYAIQRALALGLLGARHRRRLVPSRWAITAVDAAVGNALADEARDLPDIGQPLYGYIEYADNRYLALVAPGPLRFYYLERWESAAGVAEVEVREDARGARSAMDGGYEAARLAMLEKMLAMGRKGTVVLIRRIGPGYYVSVGNWQIRESIRRMELKPLDEGLGKYAALVGGDPTAYLPREAKLDEFL